MRSQWLHDEVRGSGKSTRKIRYIRLHYFNIFEQMDMENELADLVTRPGTLLSNEIPDSAGIFRAPKFRCNFPV